MTWLALYSALSLGSAAVLWPMLRMPPLITWAAPEVLAFEVIDATYDSKGMV